MRMKASALKKFLALLGALTLATSLTACAGGENEDASLTIYSGRSQEFIEPFFTAFTEATGIKLDVRYGDSAALAAQILEEGDNSPADLFLSQDAGALGAVAGAKLLALLDQRLLERVASNYRAPSNDWVAITGRARVLAYAPDRVAALPTSIDELIAENWKGRLAIAPTNSSFQAFITAMIQNRGEAATETWLRALQKNSPKLYEKNSLIVQAIDAGDVDAGLVNHYYTWEVAEELGREINVKNSFFGPEDLGNLVNVSGAGILRTSKKQSLASELIAFLLSDEEQARFVSDTHEYSIVLPELRPEGLPALNEIKAPRVDLANLSDLKRTQALLIKVGLL
ncbi:MAG: extracellular solute-binding protein [Actinomycetota bacterium]